MKRIFSSLLALVLLVSIFTASVPTANAKSKETFKPATITRNCSCILSDKHSWNAFKGDKVYASNKVMVVKSKLKRKSRTFTVRTKYRTIYYDYGGKLGKIYVVCPSSAIKFK